MQLANLAYLLGPSPAPDGNVRDGTVERGFNTTYKMPVLYVWAYAHELLVAGNSYQIVYDAGTDARWETLETATGYCLIGVATEAAASGAITQLIVAGPAASTDLTAADTVVANDYLEVITATQTANCDGTSGSTVRTARSFARALTAGASNMCDALLLGVCVDVAAT